MENRLCELCNKSSITVDDKNKIFKIVDDLLKEGKSLDFKDGVRKYNFYMYVYII